MMAQVVPVEIDFAKLLANKWDYAICCWDVTGISAIIIAVTNIRRGRSVFKPLGKVRHVNDLRTGDCQ